MGSALRAERAPAPCLATGAIVTALSQGCAQSAPSTASASAGAHVRTGAVSAKSRECGEFPSAASLGHHHLTRNRPPFFSWGSR